MHKYQAHLVRNSNILQNGGVHLENAQGKVKKPRSHTVYVT
jgi:hypothetical protein